VTRESTIFYTSAKLQQDSILVNALYSTTVVHIVVTHYDQNQRRLCTGTGRGTELL
jgi:hypothetical protein